MGYNCVVKALDLVSGNEVEDFYPAEVSIIDADNVEEFLTKLAQWVG